MKKVLPFIFIVFITFIVYGCDFSSKGTPIGQYANNKTALLVLDMQDDFIGNNARMPVQKEEVTGLVDVVNRTIEKNKANGNIIIYIRNVFPKYDIGNLFRNGAAVEGSPGTRISDSINIESDIVFDKKAPDAFSNSAFEKFLINNQVNEIEIVGVFADQCVYYTSRSALNRKYIVNYVGNGVLSNSKNAKEKAIIDIRKLGANIINE
jgi:nicotinamidase-related amidase